MAISDALGDERSIKLRQGRVTYRGRGSGPVILFVHGALVNGDLWRGVVPTLATRYRCITPDLPFGAHATPMEPDADLTPPGIARLLADFMAELELDDVTVVASDCGGAIAQILVASDPSRVDRLVLTPSDSFWGFPPRYLKPARWIGLLPAMMPIVMRAVAWTPIHRVIFWSSAKHPIEPAVMESYRAPMRDSANIRRDVGRFFRDVKPNHTRKAARKLPDFRRPTLIAWAANDLWFPVRNARKLAALIPNSRLEIIPDSRTLLAEDQPDNLAELIAAFLDEPSPPAAYNGSTGVRQPRAAAVRRHPGT